MKVFTLQSHFIAITLALTIFVYSLPFSTPPKQNSSMDTFIASGTFEVNLAPQNDNEFSAGRMTIDKQYSGDIQATGKGQMLSIRTQVEGSASYVALETVSGKLNGKSGSFTLQHLGTMNRGKSALEISIVPDSGTEDLKGISGSMTVEKHNNSHSYTLSYQFAEANE